MTGPEQKRAAPAGPPPAAGAGARGRHLIAQVMIIDDERVEQMQMARALTRSGLTGTVLTFSYADDALCHLADPSTPRPDLILLDVNMPRMNGFEFLDAASARLGPDFARSVIVMLSVELEPDDRCRMERHPAVRGFIDKPLRPEDVSLIDAGLALRATA